MANIDIESPGADETDLKAALRDLVGGFHVLAASAVAVSHTGNTNETVLATIPIPAGAIGPNGVLRVTSQWSYTNSANNKTLKVRLGGISGSIFFDTQQTTTAAYVDMGRLIHNVNSAAAQKSRGASVTGAGSTGTAHITRTVDTTVALDLVLTGQVANTGETVTLESYVVEILSA